MSTTTRTLAEHSTESTMKDVLAAHPRLIGVLFMLVLLFSQAGEAAAANSSCIAGP